MGDLSQFKTLKLDEQPTTPTSNFKTLKFDSAQSGPGAPASTSAWDTIKAEYNAEHDAAQKTRVGRFLSNAVDSGINAGSGVLHLLADASDPSPVHTNLVMNEILPAYLAGKKMVDQGVGEVKQAYNNPGNESLTNRAIVGGSGLAHIVGGVTSPLTNAPAFDAAGQQIASGHISAGLGQAVGNGAVMALGAKYGPELGEEFGPTAANTEGVLNSLTNDEPIKGATTPKMVRAHAGIIARGIAPNKNFIAQGLAEDITPAVRQTAANNPEVAATAKGEPRPDGTVPTQVEQLAAYHKLLDLTHDPINQLHDNALSSVADHPFDPSAAQDAVRNSFAPSLRARYPDIAADIDAHADSLGEINNLKAANEERQYGNRYLGPEYRTGAVARGRSDVFVDAQAAGQHALRDSYYDQLGNASGYDLAPVKRLQASLLETQERMQNSNPSLTNEQALADQNRPGFRKVLDGAGMAKSVGSPTGVLSILDRLTGGKPLTQISYNIKNLLDDLPEPSPYKVGPYRGPLDANDWNGPAGTRPALPADVPTNVENTPDSVQAGIPNHFNDWVRRNAGVQTTPAVPQYPQLPAQAGPDGFAAATGERVHPYNMQVPTGYTTDPTGATRIDFSAPDSLLNMLRMKAGTTPFDQYARPRDPQQMDVNSNNPQLGSGLPQANNVSVAGSIVNGPPRPTNPLDVLTQWQQDRFNGN